MAGEKRKFVPPEAVRLEPQEPVVPAVPTQAIDCPAFPRRAEVELMSALGRVVGAMADGPPPDTGVCTGCAR